MIFNVFLLFSSVLRLHLASPCFHEDSFACGRLFGRRSNCTVAALQRRTVPFSGQDIFSMFSEGFSNVPVLEMWSGWAWSLKYLEELSWSLKSFKYLEDVSLKIESLLDWRIYEDVKHVVLVILMKAYFFEALLWCLKRFLCARIASGCARPAAADALALGCTLRLRGGTENEDNMRKKNNIMYNKDENKEI